MNLSSVAMTKYTNRQTDNAYTNSRPVFFVFLLQLNKTRVSTTRFNTDSPAPTIQRVPHQQKHTRMTTEQTQSSSSSSSFHRRPIVQRICQTQGDDTKPASHTMKNTEQNTEQKTKKIEKKRYV